MVTRCTSRPSDRSRRRACVKPLSAVWSAVAGGRQHGGTPHPPVSAGARTAEAPAGADESTCTPGSVAARRYRRGGGDHSSWPAVAGGLARPTRRLGRAALGRLLRGLAPGGVCRAAAVACGAGGLLPHRFTLTGRIARQAVCSLWHCPAGRPGWPLATALLCGARTFLDPRVAPRYRGRPVGSSAPSTLPPHPPRRSRLHRFHRLTGSAALSDSAVHRPRAPRRRPAAPRIRCPCAR